MTAAPLVGSSRTGSTPAQAAAGAGNISFTITAPSGIGGALSGALALFGRAILPHPGERLRRVPHHHRRMRAVVGPLPGGRPQRGRERTGVAHPLVALPAGRLVAVAEVAEEVSERLLVLVEGELAGLADHRRQPRAERRILGQQGRRPSRPCRPAAPRPAPARAAGRRRRAGPRTTGRRGSFSSDLPKRHVAIAVPPESWKAAAASCLTRLRGSEQRGVVLSMRRAGLWDGAPHPV